MSARHAGFASVITIDGGLVNEMVSAASAIFPAPSFSLPDVVTVGPDEVGIAGSVSFLTPTLSFAANPENLIGVAAGAVGLLQLTVNGEDAIEVQLTLTFSLNVGLFIDVSPSSLALGPDFSDASVTSVSIAVDFGPPLAPVFKDAITSSAALNAITSALRAIPQKSVTFTVPGATGTINVSLYGVNLKLPITHVVAVPMNPNALTVAADVKGYTSGSESKLVNLITTASMGPSAFVTDPYTGTQTFDAGTFQSHTSGGTNLAATINGDFISAVVSGPISSQVGGTTVSGLTLNSISLSVGTVKSDISSSLPTNWYGCVSVSGSADYSGIGFSFSGSVTPMLIEQSSIFWDFPIATYSFGSETLDIIEFLSGGLVILGPLLINSIVDSMVANAINQLPTLGFGYSGSQPIPGLSGASVNYTVNGIVAGWDPEIDLFLAASVTAPVSSATPSPPTFALSAPSRSFTDPAPIPVTLSVSDSALLSPILGLHISWTVVRQDTGATVLSQDTLLTSSALKIAIDRWTGDLKYNQSWSVTCKVYHPADPVTPKYTYFNKTLKVAIAMPTFALSSPPHPLTNPSPIPVTLSISDSAVLDPSLGLVEGLTISWTAVRQDTLETVLNQVTPLSPGDLSIEIDRWTGTLIYNNTWLVTCKLYHPADAEVPQTTYFNQTLSVGVTDVVDRHHPYVRWQHTAFFHDPASPIPGLPLKEHRLWHRSRHSRIHRTDLLIRCEVLNSSVSALLNEQGGVQAPPTPPSLSYVDTLDTFGTFANVEHWRKHVLCDYCFFGGPTRTTWKTPTPPTPPWV
jgi:hypothetical protein